MYFKNPILGTQKHLCWTVGYSGMGVWDSTPECFDPLGVDVSRLVPLATGPKQTCGGIYRPEMHLCSSFTFLQIVAFDSFLKARATEKVCHALIPQPRAGMGCTQMLPSDAILLASSIVGNWAEQEMCIPQGYRRFSDVLGLGLPVLVEQIGRRARFCPPHAGVCLCPIHLATASLPPPRINTLFMSGPSMARHHRY